MAGDIMEEKIAKLLFSPEPEARTYGRLLATGSHELIAKWIKSEMTRPEGTEAEKRLHICLAIINFMANAHAHAHSLDGAGFLNSAMVRAFAPEAKEKVANSISLAFKQSFLRSLDSVSGMGAEVPKEPYNLSIHHGLLELGYRYGHDLELAIDEYISRDDTIAIGRDGEALGVLDHPDTNLDRATVRAFPKKQRGAM